MITIEELSAYNRKLVDMNLKLRKENDNLKKRNSDEECLKRLAKKGYIKFCAKANEWHKVADGDLPKNEDFVCNQDGLPCWFDIETDQWLDCEGTQIRTTEWCEIPKYTEE